MILLAFDMYRKGKFKITFRSVMIIIMMKPYRDYYGVWPVH